MEIRDILARCDHTLLRPTAVWEEIKELCDDGIRFSTASVCIPASFVRCAAEYAAGRVPVCTVIGFPNGYDTTESKVFMAKDAIGNGADEIDMVINLGWAKERRYDAVLDEIRRIKDGCGEKILKVIIETCVLDEDEKIRMCEIVTASGADFIKTSTGFGKGGATAEDVRLFAAHKGPGLKIKAAGGISSLADAEMFIALGADRLGTSKIVSIAKKMQAKEIEK